MGFLTWLIVGAVVGWLAGILVKGRGFGLLGNIVIGVIGAIIGGWLAGTFLNIGDPISGFNLTTLVVAIVGAVLFLYVARLVKSR
jgi:uncharacterized membrane protein YeaQ/YmgE (transglycosylase-associated protein family)